MGSREFAFVLGILFLLIVPILIVDGKNMKTKTWSASLYDVELPVIISIDPPPDGWGPDRTITFRVNTSIPWDLAGHFLYFMELSSQKRYSSQGNWTSICRYENFEGYTRLIKFITYDDQNESWIRIKVKDNHGGEEISTPFRIRARPPFPIFNLLSPALDIYHLNPQQTVRIGVEHGERTEHPFNIEYRLTTRGPTYWTPWKRYNGDQGRIITTVVLNEHFRRGDQNFVQIRLLNNNQEIERTSKPYNILINTYPEIVVLSPHSGTRLVEDQIIVFDASESFDPDGDPLIIAWFKSTPTGLESIGDFDMVRAILRPGEYTITVIAKDSVNNQVQETFTITVEPRPVIDPDHQKDTDGDGMYDEWEIKYKLNPFRPDGFIDTDHDMFTNFQEYQNKTDPTLRSSHPPYPEQPVEKASEGDTEDEYRSVTFGIIFITLVIVFVLIPIAISRRRNFMAEVEEKKELEAEELDYRQTLERKKAERMAAPNEK